MLRLSFEFIVAVLFKWQGYVTGGIIVALMFVWERITKRQIELKYVVTLVVGSLLVSFFLAWNDQRTLAEQRQKSAQDLNAVLDNRNTLLLDRINTVHRIDPAVENLGGIIGAFSSLARVMGENNCAILMTEPRNATPSVFDALFLGSGIAGCPSGGHGGVNDDPVSEANMLKGEDPNAVTIHAPKDAKGILAIYDALGPLFNVRRSYEPLPGLAPGIIWFQVGRNVKWNRQVDPAQLDSYLAK